MGDFASQFGRNWFAKSPILQSNFAQFAFQFGRIWSAIWANLQTKFAQIANQFRPFCITKPPPFHSKTLHSTPLNILHLHSFLSLCQPNYVFISPLLCLYVTTFVSLCPNIYVFMSYHLCLYVLTFMSLCPNIYVFMSPKPWYQHAKTPLTFLTESEWGLIF